jgi:nucleotide sugar dehydrogenase
MIPYSDSEDTKFGVDDMKVCVIGLGNIGLPVALHVSKFYETCGCDISSVAIKKAIKAGLKASMELEDPDICIIAVNTWFKNSEPDMSAVDSVCSKISDRESLVCFESTLSVGTAREMADKYGFKHVVACPHRWWQYDQKNYGVVQKRVFGALNDESLLLGKKFYGSLGIPITVLSSLETAEMTKVTENAYRFVEIAFAESLFLACQKNGVSFDELRRSCNTLEREDYNVKILEAREGIGGECLPKDVRYLQHMMSSPILQGAISIDEKYRKFVEENDGVSLRFYVKTGMSIPTQSLE